MSLLYKQDPTQYAQALQSFLSLTRDGKDPQVAAEEMVQKATRDKVISQDPSLAVSKDPVEESYTRRATVLLDKQGKKTSVANIQYVVNQLKAAEKA